MDMGDKTLAGVVEVCVAMQSSVFHLAGRYEREAGRFYYVTPTSYLELINAFKARHATPLPFSSWRLPWRLLHRRRESAGDPMWAASAGAAMRLASHRLQSSTAAAHR